MKKFKEMLFFNPFEEYFKTASSLSISVLKHAFSICLLKKGPPALKVKFSRAVPMPEMYPGPSELISTAMVILSESGIDQKDIILSVPDEWIFSKVVDLPRTVDENLTDVISFEMDRYTPFTPDQVFYDFRVLKKTDERLKIVIYLINKERLNPYLNRFKEEGMNVRIVTFHHAAEAFFFGISRPGKNTLFIEPRQDGTNIVFSHSSVPLFGETALSKGNEVFMQRVTEVIEKGIEGYRPDEIIIDDGNNGIGTLLKDATSLPVIASKELTIKGLKAPISSLGASAMGIYSPSGIDLMSSGERKKPKRAIGVTTLLVFLLLLFIIIHISLPIIRERREVDILTDKIYALKGDVNIVESLKKKREKLKGKITVIGEFKRSGTVMLEILREVTSLMPDDTWLTRLEIKDTGIVFGGFSESATKLISILEASHFFKNVNFSSTTVKDRRMNKERFRIKAELEERGAIDDEK